MYDNPLTVPTDLEILELLSTGERQTPANVAAHLDHDSRYMSERLRNLEERGYIRDAPPADRSGMYELTNLGAIAAFHIQTYVRDYHNIFLVVTEAILNKQPENAFYPDLITTDDVDRTALHELNKAEGLTVPSELHIEIVHDAGYAPQTANEALYSLFYHGLAERVDNMDVYRITERGEKAVDLLFEDVTDPVELTDRLRETYTNDERKRLNTLMDEMT
jgi:DNA-binding MarR family transcriptional regulator